LERRLITGVGTVWRRLDRGHRGCPIGGYRSLGGSRGPGYHTGAGAAYYFNYHHAAIDTLDKVNPLYLAGNAAVIAVTAYALADASNPLPACRQTLRR